MSQTPTAPYRYAGNPGYRFIFESGRVTLYPGAVVELTAAEAASVGADEFLPVGAPDSEPSDLDGRDKAGLLEVAAAEGIEVNPRLGEQKLREAIAAARATKTAEADDPAGHETTEDLA